MVIGVISSLLATVIVAIVALLWRNRRNHHFLHPRLLVDGRTRISFATILRIKDDDCYVLFRASSRPTYGPPGGIFKYYPGAQRRLDELEYQDETRPKGLEERRRRDLRGFIPARSITDFERWFDSGRDRESAVDALRRELAEEVGEVGHAELAGEAAALTFTHVRTVTEGPRHETGSEYANLRRFEVYD